MVWSSVLGVEQERVLAELSRAVGLLPNIKMGLTAAGDEFQLEVFDHFAPAWARCLFAPEVLRRPWVPRCRRQQPQHLVTGGE